MTFEVLIQRAADHALKTVYAGEWDGVDEASEWYWTDGNMGCDCNLGRQFGDKNAVCGNSAYRVIEFRLSDGRVVPCEPALNV